MPLKIVFFLAGTSVISTYLLRVLFPKFMTKS